MITYIYLIYLLSAIREASLLFASFTFVAFFSMSFILLSEGYDKKAGKRLKIAIAFFALFTIPVILIPNAKTLYLMAGASAIENLQVYAEEKGIDVGDAVKKFIETNNGSE